LTMYTSSSTPAGRLHSLRLPGWLATAFLYTIDNVSVDCRPGCACSAL
jgi:hypothetical protein